MARAPIYPKTCLCPGTPGGKDTLSDTVLMLCLSIYISVCPLPMKASPIKEESLKLQVQHKLIVLKVPFSLDGGLN